MDFDWHNVAAGAGMTILAHPFTYVKVLVQLGHEPLAPVMRRNMFFRRQLQYPSIFAYMKHIRQTDGFLGLYRGVAPRLCANLSASISYCVVGDWISQNTPSEPPTSNDDVKTMINKVWFHTSKEMVARCTAIIISQPFHVIAARTMAEFIGRETLYDNMFSSMKEIYNQEGILGFFAGLAPRLLAEIISIWLTKFLAHALNTYVLTEGGEFKELRNYSTTMTSYVGQSITYPLSVTATVMAVNGSRLRIGGSASTIPIYDGSMACLRDLYKKGQHTRGSSMWFRKAVSYAYSSTQLTPMPPPPVTSYRS